MSKTLPDFIVQTTCRVITMGADGSSQVGTAFFYSFETPSGNPALALVTNRHVCEGMVRIRFVLSRGDDQGNFVPGEHLNVDLDDLEHRVTYHPDPSIDLACFAIGDVLKYFESQGLRPMISAISEKYLPPEQPNFTAIEEIVMVGYPTGLFDDRHNLPIVRRGITASSYNFDYRGRPEFLIDAACFPGSSGSPVMIASTGAYATPEGMTFGPRFILLGVLWGGPQFTPVGRIEPVPIPHSASYISRTEIPMNLGYCVKAREVRVLIQFVVERAVRLGQLPA